MAFSRREFVRILGAGGAAVASSSGLIGYGREEAFAFQQGGVAQRGQRPATTGPAPIRLSSNENLRGPSPKVIEALKAAPSRELGLGYPPVHVADFQAAIANMWGAKPQNVLMATARVPSLVAGVMAFCQTEKPLVTADPSYGAPAQTAGGRSSRSSQSRSTAGCSSISTGWSRPRRRRTGVPVQSEQPVLDHPHAGGCRIRRAAHQGKVAGNGHPDRRGVHRLRHGSRAWER